MTVSSLRAEFGARGNGSSAARPASGARSSLKRSHVIALSAVGFLAVAAAGYSLTGNRPAEPVEDIVDIANLDALPEAQSQSQARSGGGGMPMIIPVVLPRPNLSPPAPAVQAPAAPVAPQTVQRGGFGDTAKAQGSSGGSSAVAS